MINRKKVRIAIDGEWNSFGGEFLSFAMVADDGEEFYVEFETPRDIDYHPWVIENVLPHMSTRKFNRSESQYLLQRFLNQYHEVEIIADWPEDIERLCGLMIVGPGMKIQTPPVMTFRIMSLDSESKKPHHALYDARGIMECILSRDIEGE